MYAYYLNAIYKLMIQKLIVTVYKISKKGTKENFKLTGDHDLVRVTLLIVRIDFVVFFFFLIVHFYNNIKRMK